MGSYKSALRLAELFCSSFSEPPKASTCPVGRMVAFISMRGWLMLGPNVHASGDFDKSINSVVAVEGLAPPMIITVGE